MKSYRISKPRLNCEMLTISQSYAAAMRAKINSGGGLLINMEGYDTFFQLIKGSKQIVVPNNKRMVSKIYAFFLDNDAQTNRYKDTYRSCVQGSGVAGVGLGRAKT